MLRNGRCCSSIDPVIAHGGLTIALIWATWAAARAYSGCDDGFFGDPCNERHVLDACFAGRCAVPELRDQEKVAGKSLAAANGRSTT
jgi:hypothetical protein